MQGRHAAGCVLRQGEGRDGSVVIKRSRSFAFCEDGLVLDGNRDGAAPAVVPADLVILATGFRGDQKLRDMFVAPRVKAVVAGASSECQTPAASRRSTGSACTLGSRRWRHGGDRVLGEPDQHLLDRDDGQVGGAVPGRRVPAAERGAHGAERGGVGQVHETEEQRGELLPRRHQHLVQRPTVPSTPGGRRASSPIEWFQPYGAVDYADI